MTPNQVGEEPDDFNGLRPVLKPSQGTAFWLRLTIPDDQSRGYWLSAI
ncbi:hypothetical protein H6F89_19850 [Cyanobacteria bacterium FACHB-63]|nr:hypothetical protein [Cyanobacteria bacterium FACHB-63]